MLARNLRALSSSLLVGRRWSTSGHLPGPLKQYEQMVVEGMLHHDSQQHRVVTCLEKLLEQLREHQRAMQDYQVQLQAWETQRQSLRRKLLQQEAEAEAKRLVLAQSEKGGMLPDWLTGKRKKRVRDPKAGRMVAYIKREKQLDQLFGPAPILPPAPNGVYLYGNVGCGKTLLMDLFFSATSGIVTHRRRLHFHAAMLEINERMHKVWQAQKNKEANRAFKLSWNQVQDNSVHSFENAVEAWLHDEELFMEDQFSNISILDHISNKILGSHDISGASLLCFDEVQVVDVFTAVVLAGVLERLIKQGCVVVATSNRHPSELNKDGFQRELFMNFIAKLEQHCLPILVGTEIDYRRIMSSTFNKMEETHYLCPINSSTQAELNKKWHQLTSLSGEIISSEKLPVMFGRFLYIPESCNGIAKFSFDQLCDQPVGAADYIALARHFHTIFITDIPVMSMKVRDKARRFITLIDELYNHQCQLICTAEAPPDELFLGTDEGPLLDLESLQFETEVEDNRLRQNVLLDGGIAPVATTKEEQKSIHSLLAGNEEMFAFRRAVSRLIEMQSPIYLRHLRSCITHENL